MIRCVTPDSLVPTNFRRVALVVSWGRRSWFVLLRWVFAVELRKYKESRFQILITHKSFALFFTHFDVILAFYRRFDFCVSVLQ